MNLQRQVSEAIDPTRSVTGVLLIGGTVLVAGWLLSDHIKGKLWWLP